MFTMLVTFFILYICNRVEGMEKFSYLSPKHDQDNIDQVVRDIVLVVDVSTGVGKNLENIETEDENLKSAPNLITHMSKRKKHYSFERNLTHIESDVRGEDANAKSASKLNLQTSDETTPQKQERIIPARAKKNSCCKELKKWIAPFYDEENQPSFLVYLAISLPLTKILTDARRPNYMKINDVLALFIAFILGLSVKGCFPDPNTEDLVEALISFFAGLIFRCFSEYYIDAWRFVFYFWGKLLTCQIDPRKTMSKILTYGTEIATMGALLALLSFISECDDPECHDLIHFKEDHGEHGELLNFIGLGLTCPIDNKLNIFVNFFGTMIYDYFKTICCFKCQRSLTECFGQNPNPNFHWKDFKETGYHFPMKEHFEEETKLYWEEILCGLGRSDKCKKKPDNCGRNRTATMLKFEIANKNQENITFRNNTTRDNERTRK